MTIRMRHTKGHTKNRRSHHSQEEPTLSKCPNCGKNHESHRVCSHCGQYRGRQVVDIEAKEARKARRTEKKMKELGQDPEAETKTAELDIKDVAKADSMPDSSEGLSSEEKGGGKPLSAEKLSKK